MERHRGPLRQLTKHMRSRTPRTRRLNPAMMLMALVSVLLAAEQRHAPPGHFTDLSWPEFYDAPSNPPMKSLLQGADVFPQTNGQFLVKGLKIQTFREDGTGEFVLGARDCMYDASLRTAASAGPLEIRTADGRFLTRGEGFLWQQSASVLTISNRVRTVIRPHQAPPTKP